MGITLVRFPTGTRQYLIATLHTLRAGSSISKRRWTDDLERFWRQTPSSLKWVMHVLLFLSPPNLCVLNLSLNSHHLAVLLSVTCDKLLLSEQSSLWLLRSRARRSSNYFG